MVLTRQYKTARKDYTFYSDGRVFNNKTQQWIIPRLADDGYYWLGDKPLYRYIAELFLPRVPIIIPEKGKRKICINHKDGNKLNNDVSNLEYCTPYENNKHARELGLNNISASNSRRWKNSEFRLRVSKKLSESKKRLGTSKGKRNPKFRYLVVDNTGKEYSRQELSELFGLKIYTIDHMLCKAGQYHKSFELFEKYQIQVIDIKGGQSTIEHQFQLSK